VKDFTDFCLDPVTHQLTRGKIVITNYEAMEMEELHKYICEWQPEILVCDESQRLKNFKSVRAKGVIALLGEKPVIGSNPPRYTREVKHCYILTGTPILNSAMDIFNQYRILDSGKTFGLNFYEFRGTYFEDLNKGMPSHLHFPKWIPRQETYEILNKKIYTKALRVMKKDCLDLPPLVRQRLNVGLGKEQQRLYDEMKRDFITWVKAPHAEPRAVVAQMALTKALRLQQIVSGFAKTEDGQEVVIKDNPRLAALDELLEDLTPSHKVIVWATFHQNYRQIAEVCKARKIEYVELHGGISTVEKDKAIKRFQNDVQTRVIIANQAAAGIGINLVEHPSLVESGRSSYSIFYSKNFSLEQDLQAESRNYRGGSEVYESVTRIDLVAPETIDELILQALAEKQNIAEQVLGWGEKV
jgi:SNF2 family DNA or RNA helicase